MNSKIWTTGLKSGCQPTVHTALDEAELGIEKPIPALIARFHLCDATALWTSEWFSDPWNKSYLLYRNWHRMVESWNFKAESTFSWINRNVLFVHFKHLCKRVHNLSGPDGQQAVAVAALQRDFWLRHPHRDRASQGGEVWREVRRALTHHHRAQLQLAQGWEEAGAFFIRTCQVKLCGRMIMEGKLVCQ